MLTKHPSTCTNKVLREALLIRILENLENFPNIEVGGEFMKKSQRFPQFDLGNLEKLGRGGPNFHKVHKFIKA